MLSRQLTRLLIVHRNVLTSREVHLGNHMRTVRGLRQRWDLDRMRHLATGVTEVDTSRDTGESDRSMQYTGSDILHSTCYSRSRERGFTFVPRVKGWSSEILWRLITP